MNLYEETICALWLNEIKGISLRNKKTLIEYFMSFQSVYQATKEDYEKAGFLEWFDTIENQKNLEFARQHYDKLYERGIQVIHFNHSFYPVKLKQIYDPPIVLFVKGIIRENLRIHNRCIGIVGARTPSVYGSQMANYFAENLAKHNYSIISGLARGVDGIAHKGALLANGYTVAVLGCGINVTYPKEHVNLYAQIEENGAIISEYGLDVAPLTANFPRRNRIISGLSDGILVIEAKKKSGSLITADCALEQGRQVYAIPGRISDRNSEGTNNLIKQGAMCVTDIEDIIFDMEGSADDGQMVMMLKGDSMELSVCDTIDNKKNALAPIEKMVYSCLSLDPVYIDDIIQKAGIGITKVISVLYELERKGFVSQPLKGYYIVTL